MPTGGDLTNAALQTVASPKATSLNLNKMEPPSRSQVDGESPDSGSRYGGKELPRTGADEEESGSTRRTLARRSSSIVYPEAEDVGKPKMFARQSFVVSGEEEEMAAAILQARQIAGERRRSTADYSDKGEKAAVVAAAACSLAARRDSKIATLPAGVGAGAGWSALDGVGDWEEVKDSASDDPDQEAASQRRRSSVLNRIPDKLRTLVQQSDADGVQQRAEDPYQDKGHSQKAATVALPVDKKPRSSGQAKQGPNFPGWIRNVVSYMRRRGTRSSRIGRREGWRGEGVRRRTSGAYDDDEDGQDYRTPRASPFPEMKRPLLPPQSPRFAGRKQLILDLDETLVHSCFKPVAWADYSLNIDVDGTFYNVFVLKRPGVDSFLERVARHYEVIVFTASLPQYANPLLDILDTNGVIAHRLFREHCTFHEGYFVKDLTRIRHQSLEDTIIVDNSPMAYMFQPENAIDCTSWIDSTSDTELYVIADFLEAIVDVPDVRDIVEFWREGGEVLGEDEYRSA